MNYVFQNSNVAILGKPWNKNTPRERLQYAVGALLYAPADHKGIGQDICKKRYSDLKSVVFCLEDSILDSNLKQAEQTLLQTLKEIDLSVAQGELSIDDLPLIFIRVRSPEHMLDLFNDIKERKQILTGFILPKFDTSNMEKYQNAIMQINKNSSNTIYIMPIIESRVIIEKNTRYQQLIKIKQTVDEMKQYVLNIRVGGNDFCNVFGLRRGKDKTIYDIGVVRDTLIDIINFFGMDYVVSAPVWEYFAGNDNDESWKIGLCNELQLDRLNGFIGKTAIHPSQLPPIQENYLVENQDYVDALSILNWQSNTLGVAKSEGMRMNEVKIHGHWARKIMALADIYGVKK